MSALFGPVPSRRFGRSLGIDLFTRKTCTFDCLYCEVGSNPDRTDKVQATVPAEQVLNEISGYLADNVQDLPDHITFAGSGEPTLYRDIDRIISGIHGITSIPVVLLTNGSLLHRNDIRDRILDVDVLVPSLDAGSESVFQKLNRPVSAISYQDLLDGLLATRRTYTGHYLLEVLLVDGVNTFPDEMERLVQQINKIDPDAVQVNTVFRPPADTTIRPADADTVNRFVEMVGEKAKPVSYYNRAGQVREIRGDLLRQVILKTVLIRPCTPAELTASLGVSEKAMQDAVLELKRQGKICEHRHGGDMFLAQTERFGASEEST